MEALRRKAPQPLATESTNSPASTPTPSCDPAQGQGLCLALEPAPLPSLACSVSFSPVSTPRILGKSSHFFANQRKKKNEGLLVTSSNPADLYSWVLFPLFTAHFPTPTFTFQPTRVWLLPSPTPTKLPPTKVSVVSMPLSPAGTSCHSFGPLGTSHPAPVSITLCSVGLWTPHTPGCLPSQPLQCWHLRALCWVPYSTVFLGESVQSRGSQHHFFTEDQHVSGSSPGCLAAA